MTDDEPVYVAARRTHYHTSPDCHGLTRAREVTEQPLSQLPDDVTQCKFCSGEYQPHSSSDSFVTTQLLEDLNPDAVGERNPTEASD